MVIGIILKLLHRINQHQFVEEGQHDASLAFVTKLSNLGFK